MKEFADDNFKFAKNDRKLSNGKKTLGKEEIAHFPIVFCVFKRLVSQGHQKVSLCGNGLNHTGTAHIFMYFLAFTSTRLGL